jgi:hypothetical protein
MKNVLIGMMFLSLTSSFANAKKVDCKLVQGDIEELSLSFSPLLDKAYYFNNSENYKVACNKKFGFIICDEKKPVLTIMMPPVGNTMVIERLSDGSRVVNQFRCDR